MAMSKRDYVAIAKRVMGQTITAAPCTCAHSIEFMNGAREQKENIVHALCDAFAADNPRFDRRRFLEACGLDKT